MHTKRRRNLLVYFHDGAGDWLLANEMRLLLGIINCAGNNNRKKELKATFTRKIQYCYFAIKIAYCQQHDKNTKYAHGISGTDWFGFGALQHGRNSTSISLCRCKIHQPRFCWRVQRAPHADILMLLLSRLLWWSGKCPIFGRRMRFLCSWGLHARARERGKCGKLISQ